MAISFLHSSPRSKAQLERFVQVDLDKCAEIATLLSAMGVPPDQENSKLPHIDKSYIGNFLLFLVAICHQTSPWKQKTVRGIVDGRLYRGWEYLYARFEELASMNAEHLTTQRWRHMTSKDITLMFQDARFGRCLNNPYERAALIRDIGKRMSKLGWNTIDDAYTLSGGIISGQRKSLLNQLRRFIAFRDPLQKKSLFFLATMRNTGEWVYPDEEWHLMPPIDYHEVRGHLRIGTIRIIDRSLRTQVYTQQEVSPLADLAIRTAVSNAIVIISHAGKTPPRTLHYMFWHVFRSLCVRRRPHCEFISAGVSLPSQYTPLTLYRSVSKTVEGGHRSCPFVYECRSSKQTYPLIEHRFVTNFY